MECIKRHYVLALVIGMSLSGPVCSILEAKEAQPDVQLQQVSLFKNGLGFFVSQVTCPDKKNSFSFVPAAAPSHGTFWVSYPAKVKLESLNAKEIDAAETIEAATISELLKANVGGTVKLWCLEKEEPIEGTIKCFSEDRARPRPDPYSPGRANYGERDYAPPFSQSHLMVIETNKAEVAVDPATVRRAEFTGDKPKKSFVRKNKSMQLDVKLNAPAGGEKLIVSYLAKGITWAPSYMVDIADSNKARISAQAAVINEACDLNDVTVQLVTGFPNLQFADVVSPLALKEDLAQFLQALTRGQSERGSVSVMSNVMTQRAEFSGRAREEMMPAYGAAQVGKVAEDLFVYPVKKVHLAKGQVGYLPLFTESVPYKHIYQWNIRDYIDEEERYSYEQRQRERSEPDEQVWHCLRLENTTKVPWTTAPAEIVQDGLILGQDTLNYTAVTGQATLRITQAVNVKAEQRELETDRKRDALQLYGDHFDLITVEGKLSVANFQQKAITVEITKTLSGEVKSSQPEAKSETLARGLRRMNALRKLTWTIELGPQETKPLSYIYEVYVRR
jgi:hypothetical protein